MTTPQRTRLARNLRRLRTEAGLTQIQLGRKARIGSVHICNLEGGKYTPGSETLRRLAKALRVTMEALLQ